MLDSFISTLTGLISIDEYCNSYYGGFKFTPEREKHLLKEYAEVLQSEYVHLTVNKKITIDVAVDDTGVIITPKYHGLPFSKVVSNRTAIFEIIMEINHLHRLLFLWFTDLSELKEQ